MKRTLLILALLFTTVGFSQAPEKMSYQAIIRNADDNLLSNKTIGLQISILENTATGKTVYIETHTPTTNINGLVTLIKSSEGNQWYNTDGSIYSEEFFNDDESVREIELN